MNSTNLTMFQRKAIAQFSLTVLLGLSASVQAQIITEATDANGPYASVDGDLFVNEVVGATESGNLWVDNNALIGAQATPIDLSAYPEFSNHTASQFRGTLSVGSGMKTVSSFYFKRNLTVGENGGMLIPLGRMHEGMPVEIELTAQGWGQTGGAKFVIGGKASGAKLVPSMMRREGAMSAAWEILWVESGNYRGYLFARHRPNWTVPSAATHSRHTQVFATVTSQGPEYKPLLMTDPSTAVIIPRTYDAASQSPFIYHASRNQFDGPVTFNDAVNINGSSVLTRNSGGVASSTGFAGGTGAKATGADSIAYGKQSQATGNYSSAFGGGSIASGDFSFAAQTGKATNYASTALGAGTTASGSYAFSTGRNSIATGNTSTAIGQESRAYGDWSFAGGYKSTASGNTSVAIGREVAAEGYFSSAFGVKTIARDRAQTVVGQYNKPLGTPGAKTPTQADALFIVGSGTGPSSAQRKNAFEVRQDGSTTMKGNAAVEGTTLMKGDVDIEGSILTVGAHNSVEESPWTKDSMIVGSLNEVTDLIDGSAIFGIQNKMSGSWWSLVLGQNNHIAADNSFVSGIGHRVHYPQLQQFGGATNTRNISVFGYYSSTDQYDNNIFVVGNGDSVSSPSNALQIAYNGSTHIEHKDFSSVEPAEAQPTVLNLSGGLSAHGNLSVEGNTVLKGAVILDEAQGDIPMGIYGE